ncbi:MBL fold metallo-hydrolase [Salirhabdus sp. Marseille-P4669]|uniref:MBL fold metallo-hydrolase n=1 Tax=Salirhabdus sp. Marseille-P4669 TaxID=2042310 RepID=UPI000C7AE961|nr:MBL fold metallo-hydrolase [Salirhabdus sp. Marseille-P4669]
MSNITELGHDITLIDLYDLGMKERTGSYVIRAEELTIVETSASPSIPHLVAGLKQLNIDPNDVKHIIVTHIHLDHAGGVGAFLDHCPNANVYVHPKGRRHLANPSHLIAGARAVYGEAFDELFNPILPVPEERLIVKEDGETLQIGENRTLTFYDTPGHAKHHFSIHDSRSNGIFTGDTIGILYPLVIHNKAFVLPTTSPNHFDPDAMLQSMERIRNLKVGAIYFGHYGMTDNPVIVYDQMEYWLPRFVEVGKSVMEEHPDADFKVQSQQVSDQLITKVRTYLSNQGIDKEDDIYSYLLLDMQVCAMGIVDYLRKKNIK